MDKQIKGKIKQVAEKYSLADVYLFGSQISGFAREDSDIDIAVRFEGGLPDASIRGKLYGNIFSDLLLCFGGAKIDLIFLDEAPLHFQFKVINEGKLVYYEDFENSMNFQEKTANFYRDYKYFINEYLKGIIEMPIK